MDGRPVRAGIGLGEVERPVVGPRPGAAAEGRDEPGGPGGGLDVYMGGGG